MTPQRMGKRRVMTAAGALLTTLSLLAAAAEASYVPIYSPHSYEHEGE